MGEVTTRTRPARGFVALALACATAIPLGMSVPSAAAPTHRVLLGAGSGQLSDVADAVTGAGGRVVQTYEVAQTLLADLPDAATAPQGSFVIPNLAMKFNSAPASGTGTDTSNTFKDTIAAPDQGGAGVKVAVIDTGVDPAADITVADRINVSGDPAGDGFGHGTFMAGLVAGHDATYGGVAPEAEVVDVKVAQADGSTDLNRVLAGLQAVADMRASDPSLDVAMLALSSESPLPPYMDPLTIALDRLWDQGVTVVVASGNDGANSLTSPATDPQLLVVGAQDERDTAARSDDVVPDFSAYGTAFGSSRPDVVAPGVSLVSSSAKGSLAYTENPGSIVEDGFMKGTGTSMSAAVAAGAIATLLAARSNLSPDDAKRLIMGTAERTPALRPARGAGQGGLDLGSALTTPLNSVPELNNGPRWASKYGPAEEDGDAWAAFATAWVEGDLVAVAAAWSQMSPQTRKWAANAWSLAALIAALRTDDATWDGRKWAGRKWASEHWAGRKWAEDAWVGRKWADSDWLASVWDGRKWAGRKWANSDWLAFAWTARMVAEDAELGAMYAADTDDWSGRKWASSVWVGRKWAADAWAGRKWADYAWDGRKWAAGEWSGRKWADFAFEGRKWANDTWDGRKWALVSW